MCCTMPKLPNFKLFSAGSAEHISSHNPRNTGIPQLHSLHTEGCTGLRMLASSDTMPTWFHLGRQSPISSRDGETMLAKPSRPAHLADRQVSAAKAGQSADTCCCSRGS